MDSAYIAGTANEKNWGRGVAILSAIFLAALVLFCLYVLPCSLLRGEHRLARGRHDGGDLAVRDLAPPGRAFAGLHDPGQGRGVDLLLLRAAGLEHRRPGLRTRRPRKNRNDQNRQCQGQT